MQSLLLSGKHLQERSSHERIAVFHSGLPTTSDADENLLVVTETGHPQPDDSLRNAHILTPETSISSHPHILSSSTFGTFSSVPDAKSTNHIGGMYPLAYTSTLQVDAHELEGPNDLMNMASSNPLVTLAIVGGLLFALAMGCFFMRAHIAKGLDLLGGCCHRTLVICSVPFGFVNRCHRRCCFPLKECCFETYDDTRLYCHPAERNGW